MRHVSSVRLLSVLAVLLVFAGCAAKKEVAEVVQSKTIVFFGDSITKGHAVNEATESFYARIEKIMNSGLYGLVRTVNAGVNGDDSTLGLMRVSSDVSSHNPDIVVIAFGLNDCRNRGIDLRLFRDNLQNIIAAMPSKTTVILATSNSYLDIGNTPWGDLNETLDPFMDEIRNIAKERNLALIDVHDAWLTQIKQDNRHMESYYADPSHPSAKGHGIIFESYMNALRRVVMD